ncbi:2-keto-4-pentenoate hydratase [Azospirillum sp. RWY-5-1]|uniref:2-keto-4-pentenoate hydratase n=1 Tax=Azospirillum oleiclasticum TaxID=2735135 RepID=A0ABX2THT5_9PROT|nr:fumarylacetoacetate hydrolase family protein [Azospirillum oleiclasticum]NYZ15586.1 2-keto-4-pentenoate hydratase [Azospirillum oleiclasticum]NYZ22609.1 2-keto-4-pentenoate hydratase [Azospirillum oleiclasticum]
MTAADIALSLRTAQETGQPIAPIRDLLPAGDLDAAYAVQDANTAHWIDAGRRLVGRKIGLTSVAVQKQLGVDQPDYGMLFADMELLDGAEIAAGRLIQPKGEAEVAFVLERDLPRPDSTFTEVLGAVAYALPAIEVVDSRIAAWDIRILDTIADNASSGLYALGSTPVAIDRFDLRLCGMVMEKNGEPVSFGAGAACLGNPLNALVWLARRMAAVGRPLAAGDVVLSGALGPMVAFGPGDRLEARINGLGSVRVACAA